MPRYRDVQNFRASPLMQRRNQLRHSLRGEGENRDTSLEKLIRNRITLPYVSIQHKEPYHDPNSV